MLSKPIPVTAWTPDPTGNWEKVQCLNVYSEVKKSNGIVCSRENHENTFCLTKPWGKSLFDFTKKI